MAEQNVWTRSANRNNGNNTFIVNSSGNVNNNNAQNANRCAPDRSGDSEQNGSGLARRRARPLRGAMTLSPRGPNKAGATRARLARGPAARAPDTDRNWSPAS